MSLPIGCTMLLGVELDDESLPGFPVLRRLTGESFVDVARIRPGDGDGVFTYVPVVEDLGHVTHALVFTADHPLTIAVQGLPSDGAPTVPFDAGGLLVVLDADINDPHGRLVTANPTTTAATLRTYALFDES